MQPLEWPTRDRTYRGKWHLESNGDQERTGTLSVAMSERPTLTLDGALLGDMPDYSLHSVIGLTDDDAVDVTLVQGSFRSNKAPWNSRVNYGGGRPPVIEEKWEGSAVAVGAQLPVGSATPVREMVFRSRRLRDWAQAMVPRFEEATDPGVVGGTLTLPADINMATPWGKTVLRWNAVGAYSGGGADIRIFPEIYIEFDEPPTISQTWGLVVAPLLRLFTLFTGEGDFVECILYRTDADHEAERAAGVDSYGQILFGGWFEWISASWFATPNDNPDTPEYSHLVSSRPGSDDLEPMLTKWINLHTRAADALADYFSTMMWLAMTFEESFAHIVRALEVLHSIIEPGPRIPKGEFAAVRKKIKEALGGDPHRDLIISRLGHADAFSLADRLTKLIGLVGPRLRTYMGDVNEFVRVVRNARDNFTHASSLAGATEELANAQVILDLLMRSVLLIQLGLSESDVEERVFRSERARTLLYPVRRASDATDAK